MLSGTNCRFFPWNSLASLAVLGLVGVLGCRPAPRGQTVLVYQIERTDDVDAEDAEAADAEAAGAGRPATDRAPRTRETAEVLANRLRSLFRKKFEVRATDATHLEIHVPGTDEQLLWRVKSAVAQTGVLRFQILANRHDHALIVAAAEQQGSAAREAGDAPPTSRKVRDADGKWLGTWVDVAARPADAKGVRHWEVDLYGLIVRDPRTGALLPPSADGRALEPADVRSESVQVLVVEADDAQLSGADLGSVQAEWVNMQPAIAFSLRNADAVQRMQRLTHTNRSDDLNRRQLGIILDHRLLSAPVIRSTISDRAQITGQFTQEEVDLLVAVLRSGSLPEKLSREPVSEKHYPPPTR